MQFTKNLINLSLLMLINYAVAANTINGLRKALVIGNENYPEQGLFTKLTNPVNDATGVAKRLQEYGFTVTRVVNVGSNAMKRSINTFINNLDKNDVALVYYSGHGIVAACYEGEEQKNYLVPIQQVFTGRADICEYGVSAQWILNRLSERDGGTNILLLDSCRNVIAANKGFDNKGFVEMHGTGTFIGYASAPGQTAKGDNESEYSVFTGQLLEVLKAPNDKLPLELLFKRVRTAVADVAENFGIQQVPWSDNGLVGEEDFCFSNPCIGFTAVVSEATTAQLQREREQRERLEEENRRKDAELAHLRQQVFNDNQLPANLESSSVVVNLETDAKIKTSEYKTIKTQPKSNNFDVKSSVKNFSLPNLDTIQFKEFKQLSRRISLLHDMISQASNNDLLAVDRSLDHINTLPSLNHSNSQKRKKARKINEQGNELITTGDYLGAAKLFLDAFNLDYADSEIAGNFGYAIMRYGKIAEAKQPFIHSLALNPKRSISWIMLGQVLAATSDINDGIGCFRLGLHYAKDIEHVKLTFMTLLKNPSQPEKVHIAIKRVMAMQ